jgi:hypothetical protein
MICTYESGKTSLDLSHFRYEAEYDHYKKVWLDIEDFQSKVNSSQAPASEFDELKNNFKAIQENVRKSFLDFNEEIVNFQISNEEVFNMFYRTVRFRIYTLEPFVVKIIDDLSNISKTKKKFALSLEKLFLIMILLQISKL